MWHRELQSKHHIETYRCAPSDDPFWWSHTIKCLSSIPTFLENAGKKQTFFRRHWYFFSWVLFLWLICSPILLRYLFFFLKCVLKMGLFFLVCSKNIIQKYQWGNYAPWPPICALTVINSHLRETVTAMWPVMKTSLTPLPVSSLAVSAAGKRFARRVLRGHNNEKLRKEIQLPLETRWHLEIQMRDFLPHKLKSGMI